MSVPLTRLKTSPCCSLWKWDIIFQASKGNTEGMAASCSHTRVVYVLTLRQHHNLRLFVSQSWLITTSWDSCCLHTNIYILIILGSQKKNILRYKWVVTKHLCSLEHWKASVWRGEGACTDCDCTQLKHMISHACGGQHAVRKMRKLNAAFLVLKVHDQIPPLYSRLS